MHSQLNNRVEGSSATHGWWASLMLQRGGELLPRFAFYYQALARRPRAWRRRLRRRLAVTVSGAALLLALAGPLGPATANPAAPAVIIEVMDGEVADEANGKCSLIEGILNARATEAGQLRPDCAAGDLAGPDTVSLPANGEFVLTVPRNTSLGYAGLPLITSAVTIEGHGATIRRSDAPDTPVFRIMAVSSKGDLTMRDTTIHNGSLNENLGNFTGCGGICRGGGILSYGTLDLSACTISGNSVSSFASAGGGIFAAGQTNITKSSIIGNNANSSDVAYGGGLFITSDGQATISGSYIIDNEACGAYVSEGGGIAVAGQATITNSLIAENHVGGSQGSTFGGGIDVTGQATINGSTIQGNVADALEDEYSVHTGYGGGLSNRGETLIVDSTISGNQASAGAGLANVSRRTYDSNLTVIHSTVSGNQAVEFEATYYTAGGWGGGVFSGDSRYGENCGVTTLQGVIISGNTADTSGAQIELEPPSTEECAPTLTVDAFNVFGQNGEAGLHGLSPGATDVVPSVGLSAILGPLADNGGPTLTHALPPGSPALDIAPNVACAAEPVNGVDQRGVARNQNGAGGWSSHECDAGSFELQATPTIYLPFIAASGSDG